MWGSLNFILLSLASVIRAHGDHELSQEPIAGPHKSLWYNTLPGDGGTQVREVPSELARSSLDDDGTPKRIATSSSGLEKPPYIIGFYDYVTIFRVPALCFVVRSCAPLSLLLRCFFSKFKCE